MAGAPSMLGNIDLGIGGLSDALTQQMKQDDAERKKKLLQATSGQAAPQVNKAGLGALSILGGDFNPGGFKMIGG